MNRHYVRIFTAVGLLWIITSFIAAAFVAIIAIFSGISSQDASPNQLTPQEAIQKLDLPDLDFYCQNHNEPSHEDEHQEEEDNDTDADFILNLNKP